MDHGPPQLNFGDHLRPLDKERCHLVILAGSHPLPVRDRVLEDHFFHQLPNPPFTSLCILSVQGDHIL